MNNERVDWEKVVEVADQQFPKGRCKERGQMLVVLAYVKMALDQAVSPTNAVGTVYEGGKNESRG